jgi:anti-anti-sigma factor
MSVLIAELVYENKHWALRIELELDQTQLLISEASALRQYLLDTTTSQIAIDLSKTPRLDSTGLNFLLSLYQECASLGIQLTLRNPSYYLERIMQIMQLNRLFVIEHKSS